MNSLEIKKPSLFKILGALPGILSYLYFSFIHPCDPPDRNFFIAIGIATLTIILWIVETIPIWLSSLFPLILLPLHGIISFDIAISNYYSNTILLFLGGFLLAYSVEKWHLHKRIAFKLLSLTGDNPKGIVWGMMLTTCLISMWISNTATAIMMLPVAISITKIVKDHNHPDNKAFFICLILGIAYAANIGGIATIIGTPPNIVYKGFVENILGQELSFFKWMILGVPLSLLMLYISYWLMTNVIFKFKHKSYPEVAEMLDRQVEELGKTKAPEKRTLIIFSIAAGLWIFGQPISALLNTFSIKIKIEEYAVAMVFGLLLFLIPKSKGQKERLLQFSDLKSISWSILLLFGGGMCMAKGLEKSGVINWVGQLISGSQGSNFPLLLLIIILTSLFLTEIMSNVALANIYIPVVFGISASLGISNPHIMGIPVAIACSFAFMLPISTPPNAVVFSSGKIKVKDMAIAGFLLNIVGVLLLWLCGLFVIPYLF
ncbi:MAG: SLC13/DASS family transporter [Bacteroidia bacterium]|nr:SLC13/DASS family transporter [Bacteroidia bacterium]